MSAIFNHFAEHGWAVIPAAVDSSRIETIKALLNPKLSRLDATVGTDKSDWVTRLLFSTRDTSAIFGGMLSHPEIGPILRHYQRRPFVEHSKMLIKAPQAPDTPWHQDAAFWQGFDPHFSMITVWVAIEDVSIENGCMRIIDGTKDSQLFTHERVHEGRERVIIPAEIEPLLRTHRVVDCPVRAGEALIFASKVVHTAHPNTTSRPRMAFKVTFQDAAQRTATEAPKHQAVQFDGFFGFLNSVSPCLVPRTKLRLSDLKRGARAMLQRNLKGTAA